MSLFVKRDGTVHRPVFINLTVDDMVLLHNQVNAVKRAVHALHEKLLALHLALHLTIKAILEARALIEVVLHPLVTHRRVIQRVVREQLQQNLGQLSQPVVVADLAVMTIGHREAAYTRILFIIGQQRREQSPGLFASFDVIVVVGV